MRYLFAVIDSISSPGGSEIPGANDAFNEKIEAAGQRLIAAGICAPDKAQVFDNRNGQLDVRQQSLISTDDYMAGFWVIEAESEDVAHQLAAEASHACNRRIEVRPFLR